MKNSNGHAPPAAVDVEKSVIGSALVDKNAAAGLMGLLSHEHFFDNKHQAIVRCIDSVFQSGHPVDVITVIEELRKLGHDFPDSASYLVELSSHGYNSGNLPTHCAIIKERWGLRHIIASSQSAIQRAYDCEDVFEIADTLNDASLEVSGILTTQLPVSGKDMLAEAVARIDATRSGKGGECGITTGFRSIDDFGNFEGGDLYVLAARPSQGKTAFALSMMMRIARKYHVPFFSLEMPKRDISIRLLSMRSGIPFASLKYGKFSDEDAPKYVQAWKELSGLQFHVFDKSAITLTELRARTQRLIHEHGARGIIVDYLGLMTPPNKENRNLEISSLTAGLKAMAKDFNIFVLVLCQLNRQLEYRQNKRPNLSDLRDSGSIEQDADVVWFIHRPEMYGEEGKGGVAEIIVAKNRNGALGMAELKFEKERMLFRGALGAELLPLLSPPMPNEAPHERYETITD